MELLGTEEQGLSGFEPHAIVKEENIHCGFGSSRGI